MPLVHRVFLWSLVLILTLLPQTRTPSASAEPTARRPVPSAEPSGGQWEPIVLRSANSIPVAAPPSARSTQAQQELQELARRQQQRTTTIQREVTYWDRGGVIRWNEIARELVKKYRVSPPAAARIYALLSVAQYDSLIVTWHHRYLHQRVAPFASTQSLLPLVSTPKDPTYPSDHAAVAATSATILSDLFPQEQERLRQYVTQHQESRLWAGVNYPSDITAGDQIGRAVAEQVILQARTDGAQDQSWYGMFPIGENVWFSSANPAIPPLLPLWSQVRPWLMSSPSQFRPTPPPPLGSPEFEAALKEVKTIRDSLTSEQWRIAEFWADGPGTATPPGHWNQIATDLIRRYPMNELRAARTLALMNMAIMDAGISCWDAKYHYWLLRPSQADPSIKPALALPNFPSYTSGHATFSGAAAEVLSYIFPQQRDHLQALANEAAMSRVYGAIHYRFDGEQGLIAGRAIGGLAIERAKADGAP